MASIGALAVNLNANSSNFISGMAGAENALNKFALKAAALKVVFNIFEGLSEAVRLAAEFELVSMQLQVLTGSASQAKGMIEELYRLGLESPFGAQDFLDSAKILGQFGVSLSKTTELVKIIGDVALGDVDKFNRMSIAFGQMSASGRLMGQDLLQMVNAGMNPLFYISQRTGESLQQLRFRMEAGKVTVREVTQAFRDATAEGGRFYGATQQINMTLMGQWLQFKENLQLIGREIGAVLLPGLTKILYFINSMVKKIDSLSDATKKMIYQWSAFGLLAALFVGIAIAIGVVVTTLAAVGAAATAAGVAIGSMLFVAVPAGLLAAIAAWWYFDDALAEATEAMKKAQIEEERLNALLGMSGSAVENWSQHWIDAAEALVAAGIATRNTTKIVQQLSSASGGNVKVFDALITAYLSANVSGNVFAEDLNAIQKQLTESGSSINIFAILANQLGMDFTQLSRHVYDGKLSLDQFRNALSQVSIEAARFNTAAMFGAKYDALTGNIEITAAQNKINQMMIEGEKILKSHGSQVSIFTTMQQQLGITSQELSERLAQNKITVEEYGDAIRSVMHYRESLGEFGDIVPDLEIKSEALIEAEKLLEKIRVSELGVAKAHRELIDVFGKTLADETDMTGPDRLKAMESYARLLTDFNEKLLEAQNEEKILLGIETERSLLLEQMAETGVSPENVEKLRLQYETNEALKTQKQAQDNYDNALEEAVQKQKILNGATSEQLMLKKMLDEGNINPQHIELLRTILDENIALEKQKAGADEYKKTLEETMDRQRVLLGLETEREQMLRRLQATGGVTPAQAALLQLNLDLNDALEKRKKATDDAAQALRKEMDQTLILLGFETERSLMLQRMMDAGADPTLVENLRLQLEFNDALRKKNALAAWKPEVAGAAVKGSAEAHTLKVQHFLRDQGAGQQAVWVAIRQNGNEANRHLARIANRPPQVEFIPIGAVA
jgi:tape measure domain-containing protein